MWRASFGVSERCQAVVGCNSNGTCKFIRGEVEVDKRGFRLMLVPCNYCACVHAQYTRRTHAKHTQYTRSTHVEHAQYTRSTSSVKVRKIHIFSVNTHGEGGEGMLNVNVNVRGTRLLTIRAHRGMGS